jgi:hypothetical protein
MSIPRVFYGVQPVVTRRRAVIPDKFISEGVSFLTAIVPTSLGIIKTIN